MVDSKRFDRKKFHNINNNEVSVLDAMNSEGFKEMRRMMLADEEHPACNICFSRERAGLDSMRTQKNSVYMHRYTDLIAQTNDDGSINEFRPGYVDLRFSNTCNLKCRTCGHELSSTWFDEHKAIILNSNPNADVSHIQKFIRADEFEKIKPYLNTVDNLYWAGGEPLMEKQHYATIDYLIEQGNAHNTHMSYNTNMTTLTYKRKHITEWWRHFKNITVAASIDGMDDVFEYIRTGAKWNETRDNFNFLKFGCNDVNLFIYPSATVSILNIYQIPDFVEWCVNNKWIEDGQNLHTNFVTHPNFFSLKNLPPHVKDDIKKMLEDRKKKFEIMDIASAAHAMQHCIDFMYEPDGNSDFGWQHCMGQAIRKLDIYDKSAGLDWKKSLPELADMLTSLSLRP
jgi:MoaA/NifB/PqqE/SkfB family radical SAM enzyme